MDICILGDAFAEEPAELPHVPVEEKVQSPGLTCLRALQRRRVRLLAFSCQVREFCRAIGSFLNTPVSQ